MPSKYSFIVSNPKKIIQIKNRMTESEIESIFNEAKLLSMSDHPNILKLHRVHASRRFLFLVTSLLPGGSLKSYMRMRQITREPIKDEECSHIIKQILTGLEYIHKLNIVHRDIKPKNILIESTKNKNLHVIIADLGLSTELFDCDLRTSRQRCGTVNFMAPEQIKGNSYSTVFFD